MDLGNGGDCIEAIPNDVLKNFTPLKGFLLLEKSELIG